MSGESGGYVRQLEPGAARRRVIRDGGSGHARFQKKARSSFEAGLFRLENGLAVTYFRVRNCTLSSAQTRFTVLFGMGRRGPRLLWPPD